MITIVQPNRTLRRIASSIVLGLVWTGPLVAQTEATPHTAASSVLKATFQTSLGTIRNVGTGFLLESPDGVPVFVTALHVFGPPGGLPEWVAGTDLPDLVESATLTDAFTLRTVGHVVGVVPTPRASLPTIEGGEPGRDFAVFRIADGAVSALKPAVGQDSELWIVSPGLPDGDPLRVTRVAGPPHFVSVEIPEDLELPFGISGSPIVTGVGEAVALVAMLGRGPNGERVIHATPIEAVVEALGGDSDP